ncbi:45646_t:CDS:2 [Gigaspora margarita]|uniref:45646_t:CDS:1 n=1 Tax=Gigaspora margarita TaxID=4874 RepID=A0ABN7WI23_GIGMA|nr:45646_t:CDS:2 [Gigaspora margarita]
MVPFVGESVLVLLVVQGTGNYMKKRLCFVCGFPTDADSEYCAKYCSKYSAKFHTLNYRIRQKYEAEARQPRIPEAPIFEPGNGDRIYEAPVSESDDEDIGLDLFGD